MTNMNNLIDKCILNGISVVQIKKKCHYHKKPGVIGRHMIVEDGLSPTLLYLFYPYLFALAYGAQNAQGSVFFEPLSRSPVNIEVNGEPLPLRVRFGNVIRIMFKTFLRKTSIRRLPAIIQRDKKFVFDLLRLNTVCPAALRSAYPFLVKTYLKNMTTNHVGNWGANCPDHIKNITLGNNDADCLTSDIICEWGSDAYIQTKVACKNCSTFFSGTITDAAAKVGVPCPVLLNIAYGYYLTIRNGGELGFYSRDLHAAIFQCPNPKSRVVVKISRKDSSGVIALLVINIFGSGCNKKIKVGDEFIISENKLKGGFCLDAFNSLFLYSGISKFFTSPAIIHCIIGDCNAQWEIGHKK